MAPSNETGRALRRAAPPGPITAAVPLALVLDHSGDDWETRRELGKHAAGGVDWTEHMFDLGWVTVVGKWWNGRWGRLARRDIRLSVRWEVEALSGGADGRAKRWEFDDEVKARGWVEHLMGTGGDGWKDVT